MGTPSKYNLQQSHLKQLYIYNYKLQTYITLAIRYFLSYKERVWIISFKGQITVTNEKLHSITTTLKDFLNVINIRMNYHYISTSLFVIDLRY